MKKRVAKKILKKKDILKYSPRQIEAAQKKLGDKKDTAEKK